MLRHLKCHLLIQEFAQPIVTIQKVKKFFNEQNHDLLMEIFQEIWHHYILCFIFSTS